MAKKLEFEVEVKSSADKFWEAIRDFADLYPKIFPDQFKSIEILQGDGKSVGSIRLVKYAQGVPVVTFSTEKIEVADETNKIVVYTAIDGELSIFYKNYRATLQVVPKAKATTTDQGSLVKYTIEYDEKASEEVPEPDLIQEHITKGFNDLDAYLLASSSTHNIL